MANRRASGGLIGKSNKTSGGGNTVTRFNTSGSFTVQKNTTVVDVLTVAGGGSGGKDVSGGGGAGGYRNLTNQTIFPGGSFPITVGAGGASQTSNAAGNVGNDSVFSNPFNPITSDSGGFGGGNVQDSGDGGSGGGGGGGASDKTGGAGNTPPTTPPQGNTGGTGDTGPFGGGGGGGAGAVGAGPVPGYAGHGGIGAISSVTGTQTYYAGGGGGGARAPRAGGIGGVGGGGPGTTSSTAGGAGTTNTGSGGGGTDGGNSGAGGSGVVIVKELDKAQGVFDMKSQFTAHTKGQWPTRTGVDEISNSLLFNSGDSPQLSRTPSTAGNRKTYTISCWVKQNSNTGMDQQMNMFGTPSEGDTFYLDGGRLLFFQNGSSSSYLRTNSRYRDPSAWYHFVVAVDTTQATSTDRVKLYVNGEQYVWDASTTYPALNYEGDINNTADAHEIGSGHHNSYYNGYMSEFYLIDGQALTPGLFGEPDPDCPQIWRPKLYRGTYGTNGFHMEFKQSGVGSGSASTVGADTSGNGNHLTSSGIAATDQSIDTPTNNFAVLNPLDQGTVTLSEGNTKIVCDASNNDGCRGTMGFPASGKWYFEFYLSAHAGGTPPQLLGIAKGNADVTTWVSGGEYIVYEIDSGKKRIDGSQSVYGATATTGDTIGVAVNMDDNEVIFYKNGSTQGTISNEINTGDDYYLPYIMDGSSARSHVTYANFGNPAFSISSGNADGNGYGNFEHAVPNGHYALCTKNLAQYG